METAQRSYKGILQKDHGREKAVSIKWLFTDVDGVLTDNGVYYSAEGESLKRFSIRDGMGVERLMKCCGITTGIITGEQSQAVARRAEKLGITELYLGARDKASLLTEIIDKKGWHWQEIAYIGDDVNDLELIRRVGFSACPADAMTIVREQVDYICLQKGGDGAFREFAEFLIAMRS